MKTSGKPIPNLLTAVVLAVVLSSPAVVAAAEYKLRCASIYPAPDVPMSMGKALQIWQEELNRLTGGKFAFENFYGATIGKGPEHIDLVGNRTVDVAQTFPWYTPGRFPIHGVTYVLPFGPSDPVLIVKANRQLREKFPQLVEDEKKNKVLLISDPPGGVYDFMSRKPLRTLEDFKGEKVSLVGRYFGRWLPPGATAVVRPMHDRYELLQNGVVNIDLHPFTHFHFTKVYELVKYYTSVGLMAGFHSQILINLEAFQKMPPEIQKAVLEAGRIAEDKMAQEVLPAWFKSCQAEFEKAGVQFSKFPAAEIKKWADSLEDVPAEWAAEVEAKGYPGFAILEFWQKTTADLGFQWARKWGVKK
ncbi:MAG: TRAP transporter substrate-binding protein DctP [Desulfobacterales bacterium]